MRDLYGNVLVTQIFNPAVSTTTRTSATVDLQGFNSANLVVCLGQAGDTLSGSVYWTLKITHSSDDVTYTDTVAADMSQGITTMVVNATTLDKAAYGFGYIGAKRYLRAVATPTGTHSVGTPIGMVALRGTPNCAPVQ